MSRYHLLLLAACLVLVKMCSAQSTSLRTMWEAVRENQESISDLEKESREKDVENQKRISDLEKESRENDAEISELQDDLQKALNDIVLVKNELNLMKGTTEATPTTSALTTTPKPSDLCKNGVLYGGRCFKFFGLADSISDDDAVKSCRARNMRLANIYSKAHYDKIMAYLREALIPNKLEYALFWLGMIGKRSIQTPVLRDGTVAPYVKWNSGEPKSFYYEQRIGLKVHEGPNSLQQGMFTAEWLTEISNIICEST